MGLPAELALVCCSTTNQIIGMMHTRSRAVVRTYPRNPTSISSIRTVHHLYSTSILLLARAANQSLSKKHVLEWMMRRDIIFLFIAMHFFFSQIGVTSKIRLSTIIEQNIDKEFGRSSNALSSDEHKEQRE